MQAATRNYTNKFRGCRIYGHPIHPALVPFPIAFLFATLAADMLYALTKDSFFADGSLWMLGGALSIGLFAAIAGLVELLSFKHIFEKPTAHFHALGNAAAIVLSTINFHMRYKQGPMNFVLPGGIFISALVCGGVIVSGILGQRLVYRYGIGVTDVTKPRGHGGTMNSRIPPDTFRKEE